MGSLWCPKLVILNGVPVVAGLVARRQDGGYRVNVCLRYLSLDCLRLHS